MSKFLKFKNLVTLLYYFLISILLILLFKTCQINQSDQPSKQLEGKLLIRHSIEGKVSNVISDAVKKFESLNPQVRVITQFIPPNRNPSLFVEESQRGFGESMLILQARNIGELVKKRLINPINSESIDLSTYFPTTLNQVRYGGQVYGVPLGSQTQVLCYNKAKLQITEDPIFSNPPRNLDGLIERAKKGYSVGLVSSFEETFWGMGAFGGRFFNEQGLLEPNLGGWAEWIDWLKKANLQPNFILASERSILHNAFAQGELAYYICDSGEIPDLETSLQDSLRIALLPQGEKGKAIPLLKTTVIVFNKSNSASENNLGLAFTKFMTNPEQQLIGIIKTQSFIPSNRNVNPNVDLLPLESVLLKQVESAIAIPLDNLEQFTQVFEKGEILYQQAFQGEILTTEAPQKLMMFMNSLTE